MQLRQKWRNIRDCFVKAHKAITQNIGYTANKKKHYAYYNNLTFLIGSEPDCTSKDDVLKNNQNSENENGDAPNEDNRNVDSQNENSQNENSQNENSQNEYVPTYRRLQYEIVQNDSDQEYAWTLKRSNEIKSEYSDDDSEESQSDVGNSCSSWCPSRNKRSRNSDNEHENEDTQDTAHTSSWEPKRIKMEEAAIEANLPQLFEEDENRMFLLSLVNEIKKVPETRQLQTKLEILKVIRDAQSGPY